MTAMQMLLLGGKSSLFQVTIGSNTSNVNIDSIIRASPYFWDGISPPQVTATVSFGVTVTSTSTAVAALDTGALVSGATFALINNGSIIGLGGDAGVGQGDTPSVAGNPGGDALNLSSFLSGHVTITNGSGDIWGGGGGGGGGGLNSQTVGGKGGTSSTVGGSGGGGGAGGGNGAAGGVPTGADSNTDGLSGTNGSLSTSGTGGAAQFNDNAGPGFSGAGGAGGNFGSNGLTGGDGTGIGTNGPGSLGGTGGNAIRLNGGSMPTFISGSGSPNILGNIS